MKPWENVKRNRQRRQLFVYSGIVVAGFVAIIITSNLKLAAPIKPLSQDTVASRNNQRQADLASIGTSLSTYLASHPNLPYALPKTPIQICSVVSAECKKTKLVDLNYLITTDTGLASIPNDPIGGHGYGGNGYTVTATSDGHILFAAPRAEDGKIIELKK